MQRTILFGIFAGRAFSLRRFPLAIRAVKPVRMHRARPKYIEGIFEVKYDSGCTGHDEPELDPFPASQVPRKS